MNNYQIDIQFRFKELEKDLNNLNKQTRSLGENISFTKALEQVDVMRSKLKSMTEQLNADLSKAALNMQAQFKKASVLSSMGASVSTVNARANQAQPYIDTINSAKQLKTAITQVGVAIDKNIIKAKEFAAVHSSAKAATGNFLSQLTLGNVAKDLTSGARTAIAQKAAAANNLITAGMQNLTKQTGFFNVAVSKNMSLLGMWWQHFGRIALGFTIAYRAMQAFGMLLMKTTETIKNAIVASGDLATLQGKLAMFTVLASNGTISFDKAFTQSGEVVQNLATSATKSISSIQELGSAMDELAQVGILIPPNLTKEFVSFADFTNLISQTTGDNVRQLRSELNGLVTGQVRANNVLIRALLQFGALTKQDLQDLKGMHNQAEIVEKVMMKIHTVWSQFMEKAIASNPTLAFTVWEKTMQRVLISSIGLVSGSLGQLNLFGNTIKKHIDTWNKEFSGDLTKNIEVKRFAILMLQINKGVDFALTAFEKLIKGIASIATAFDNLDSSIKSGLKFIFLWESMMLLTKGLFALGRGFRWLNESIILAIVKLGAIPTIIIAAGLAAFIAINGFSAWTGQLWSTTLVGTLFANVLQKIIDLWDAMPKGLMAWAATGAAIGGLLGGGIPGALMGGATMLAVGSVVENAYNRTHSSTLKLRDQLLEDQKLLEDAIIKNKEDLFNAVISKDEGQITILSENGKSLAKTLEDNKKRIEDLNSSNANKPSFIEATGKQMISSIEALALELGPKFDPLIKRLKDKIQEIINPNIDLTNATKNGIFEKIPKKVEIDLKALKTELGSFDYNLYDKFIKAVNGGEIKNANAFAGPAYLDLDKDITKLKRQKEIMEILIQSVKKGSVDWANYTAGIAGATAEIDDFLVKQGGIEHKRLLAPAVNIAERFKREYDTITTTIEDGSDQQIRALIELRDKYSGSMEGFEIDFSDKKQISSLEDYTKTMEKLRDVSLTWSDGMKQGFKELAKPSLVEGFKNLVINAANSMEDAIVNFAKNGKAAFSDMANSIIADMIRIMVRSQITTPFANLMLSTFFSSFNPSAVTEAGSAASNIDRYSYSTQIPHADGGWLNEKVIGIGLSTGKTHSFAEHAPEYITPAGQVGASTQVNIYNAPAGTKVEESQDTMGGKRIDVYIDEIMAGKLAGSSKTSSVLRKMYGVSPALAGR